MRSQRLWAVALVVLLAVCGAAPAFGWSGRVVHVADGDTLTVLNGTEKVKVRLYGVDTPEKKQAFGMRSKAYTAALAALREVEVDEIDRDRYGRSVALVRLADGSLLNEKIIAAGTGWVYDSYCRKPFCRDWKRLEKQARSERAGLWGEAAPTPPWQWRKGKRSGQAVEQCAGSGLVRGNVKSRAFHLPGCRSYDCKNCTATFASPDEARRAGYRECGICGGKASKS